MLKFMKSSHSIAPFRRLSLSPNLQLYHQENKCTAPNYFGFVRCFFLSAISRFYLDKIQHFLTFLIGFLNSNFYRESSLLFISEAFMCFLSSLSSLFMYNTKAGCHGFLSWASLIVPLRCPISRARRQ